MIMNKIDLSYASKSEHNFAQRLIIKTIENITGKRTLVNLYNKYSLQASNPNTFWEDLIKIMDIKVKNKSKHHLNIPSNGPLMIIANHPFGIIDGLILCALISKKRKDFKIMTHETLKFLPELNDFVLPVDFSEKKEAKFLNFETAKKAKNHLLNNGALIIFPSGSVSTAINLKSEAKDDEWKTFPAKLIQITKTRILPIYFDGKNGLMFHLFASKIKNQTLKYSTYIHETRKKIGKEITIYSGKIIEYKDVSHLKNRAELTKYLKAITYNLKHEND